MSATGTVNDSAAAVMRRFTATRDERAVLSSVVTHARKATRYRASTVVTRKVAPLPASEWKRCHRAMVTDASEAWASTADTDGHNAGTQVVRPGGRIRLSDMHR